MCGIIGLISNCNLSPAEIRQFPAAVSILKHRGPDDEGFLYISRGTNGYRADGKETFKDVQGILGHRRLSIIDLSANGKQPMCNEDRSLWLVFNGEIYNYVELRKELAAKGHIFASETDSEVVLHAYEEWGNDCFNKFNGMWALCLYHLPTGRVILSRDRFGIKPLFYGFHNQKLYFASEIKAIRKMMTEKPGANYGLISHFLMNGFLCDQEDTFFYGIKSLKPATFMVWKKEDREKGTVRLTNYWNYRKTEDVNGKDPFDEFLYLIKDSVRLRMRSDVPVGLTLSGGMDSSTILAMTHEGAGKQVDLSSFSVQFSGHRFDESKYITDLQRQFETNHHFITPNAGDLMAAARKLTRHLDSPSLAPSIFAMHTVHSLASQHVKVVLEGQGADELLGGYYTFFPDAIKSLFYYMKKHKKLKYGVQGLRDLGAILRHIKGVAPKLQMMSQFLPFSKAIYSRFYGLDKIINREIIPADLHRLYRHGIARVFAEPLAQKLHQTHARNLLPGLLYYNDIIGMSFSLESRLPFMDYRLVEMAFNLPSYLKITEGWNKYILRKTMENRLPQTITQRRDKMGLPTPFADWSRGPLVNGIKEILLSNECKTRGIFNNRQMEKCLQLHFNSKRDYSYRIWRWLTLELWFQECMDN